MDLTASAQNQKSPNDYKPLPINPSDSSQIFIHPDHEAGVLPLNPNPRSAHKSKKLFLEILFSAVIFISVVSASLLFFVFIPRSQNVVFANSVRDTVSSSSERAAKINSSLDLLYKALTNQSQKNDGVTLSDASSTPVLGISTVNSDIIGKTSFTILENLKDTLDKISKVKGFSAPSNDPNKESRDHRALANDVATKIADQRAVHKQLMDLTSTSVPSGSKKLQNEIVALVEKTGKYIDQAQKTSVYYVAISDASIVLTNLSTTTNISTPAAIDNVISTLTTLKSKFSDYKTNDLPEEIGDYNKDIAGVFDLLLNLYKDVKSGKLADESSALTAYNNFINQLKSLGVSATNHEINFWQNNKALSGWGSLANEHTDVLISAKKVKENNNFFLLNWAGIN